MNGKCWKPAVNFDALWYWTHCDNILLTRAVKHLPTGCWTSAPLHSYTPWLPYITPGPWHAKAKCVRDYMARSKIGRRHIFIRGEWASECVCVCVRMSGVPCLCVKGGGKVQSITQLKPRVTVTWNRMTDGWTKSPQVGGLERTAARRHSRETISKTPVTSSATDTRAGTSAAPPCLPPVALDCASHAALKASTVGRLRVFKNVISNAQMS